MYIPPESSIQGSVVALVAPSDFTGFAKDLPKIA